MNCNQVIDKLLTCYFICACICRALVLLVLSFSFIHSTSATIPILKVNAGVEISFDDLWNFKGHCVNSPKLIRHRFIDGFGSAPTCLSQLHLKFHFDTTTIFSVTINGPFHNSSLSHCLSQIPSHVSNKGQTINAFNFAIEFPPTNPFMITIRGFDKSHYLYNSYFLVTYSKYNTTGYPKYYVTKDTQPIYGLKPGDEIKFEQYTSMTIEVNNNENCANTCGVDFTEQEMIDSLHPSEEKSNGGNIASSNHYCGKTAKSNERQVFLKIYKDSDSIVTIRPPVENGIDSLINCALKCSQDLFLCQAVIFTQDTGECEIITGGPLDASFLPVNDKQYIVDECLV